MKLFQYSLKNAFARKLTGILTTAGVALVVFVFAAVQMLGHGLTQVLVDTGSADNAIVVRRAATTEIVSILPRGMADVIKADPGVAKNADGSPLLTAELLVVISQLKRSNDEPSNVPVRGVYDKAFTIRPQVKVTEGRMYRPGTSEIIAGAKVARNFQGCGLGETVRFGMRDWTVVGIFEAGGSGFESELWGDIDQMLAAFERPVFSSVTFRIAPGNKLDEIKQRLENDPRLTVDVLAEKEYYRSQSESFVAFIQIFGTVVSIMFSLGAIVGAMITMYAAVSNRTTEIGTLRALGFSRPAVLAAFLTEALFISILGGTLGVLLAAGLSAVEISTTNFDTFAEIAFSFRMSPPIIVSSMIFAVVMGIIGGFLPAVRASRLQIIQALRAR